MATSEAAKRGWATRRGELPPAERKRIAALAKKMAVSKQPEAKKPAKASSTGAKTAHAEIDRSGGEFSASIEGLKGADYKAAATGLRKLGLTVERMEGTTFVYSDREKPIDHAAAEHLIKQYTGSRAQKAAEGSLRLMPPSPGMPDRLATAGMKSGLEAKHEQRRKEAAAGSEPKEGTAWRRWARRAGRPGHD